MRSRTIAFALSVAIGTLVSTGASGSTRQVIAALEGYFGPLMLSPAVIPSRYELGDVIDSESYQLIHGASECFSNLEPQTSPVDLPVGHVSAGFWASLKAALGRFLGISLGGQAGVYVEIKMLDGVLEDVSVGRLRQSLQRNSCPALAAILDPQARIGNVDWSNTERLMIISRVLRARPEVVVRGMNSLQVEGHVRDIGKIFPAAQLAGVSPSAEVQAGGHQAIVWRWTSDAVRPVAFARVLYGTSFKAIRAGADADSYASKALLFAGHGGIGGLDSRFAVTGRQDIANASVALQGSRDLAARGISLEAALTVGLAERLGPNLTIDPNTRVREWASVGSEQSIGQMYVIQPRGYPLVAEAPGHPWYFGQPPGPVARAQPFPLPSPSFEMPPGEARRGLNGPSQPNLIFPEPSARDRIWSSSISRLQSENVARPVDTIKLLTDPAVIRLESAIVAFNPDPTNLLHELPFLIFSSQMKNVFDRRFSR